MSSMILSGDTSGAITVTVPAVAGTNTITLPAATGTVMVSGNMPIGAASVAANQTISAATSTKVNFDTLYSFGTATNSWDTTNKRFTPTVAGYYQIEGCVYSSTSFNDQSLVTINKNGNTEVRCQDIGSKVYNLSFNSVVYCNGTTDYLEVYVYISGGNTVLGGTPALSWVRTYMVRAA